MHLSRLRLVGFKSFVEPTELVISQGLTGVVGPNGCGKSNLLEALRWVMGESSYKSMRASAMDDVIFAGTSTRPARNTAEVTLFIDNAERLAPAEFNDVEQIEISRRIEREAGSAYRINGREARARDVKILFEDAATGARSPALVRQGQIAEIINAKPESRRRILEDAAGVAGLHSRRHEAELRLKAAEANLARLDDVVGGLNAQVEALKRQARQARRYREISGQINKVEALALASRLACSAGGGRTGRGVAGGCAGTAGFGRDGGSAGVTRRGAGWRRATAAAGNGCGKGGCCGPRSPRGGSLRAGSRASGATGRRTQCAGRQLSARHRTRRADVCGVGWKRWRVSMVKSPDWWKKKPGLEKPRKARAKNSKRPRRRSPGGKPSCRKQPGASPTRRHDGRGSSAISKSAGFR